MPRIHTYTSRDIQRRWREILDEVERDGLPCLITRNSRPAFILWPVSEESYRGLLADLVLANSPGLGQQLAAASAKHGEGHKKDDAVDYSDVRPSLGLPDQ